MVGTPHLLGADVPPKLGTILLTYSGSGTVDVPASGEYQCVFRALGADVPPLGETSGISEAQSGRTAIGDCQYVRRMPRADVPPLGATSVISGAQSGRTAISDCQYVHRMLRANVPLLGAPVVAQSGRTAIGDCYYVSRVLGTVKPLVCNSMRYSSLDINIVTGQVPIKLK
jgi:hypothetical protein